MKNKIDENYIPERMIGHAKYGIGIIMILYSMFEWNLIALAFGLALFMMGCWDLAKYSRIEEMKYGK